MRKPPDARGAASPLVVFVGLLALLGVVVGGVIWAGSIDGKPIPPAVITTPEPIEDHSLTDAEAIALVTRLDRLRREALEERSVQLLNEAVSQQGPAFRRLRKSIRMLVRDDVTVRHRRYEVVGSRVTRRRQNQLTVRQVVIVDLQFYDSRGKRVTQGSGLERQVLEATIRHEAGDWLFYDGRLIDAAPVTG